MAIRQLPRGLELLFTSDFNVDLAVSERNSHDDDIAVALVNAGLEDMNTHLILRIKQWLRDFQMWSMIRRGRMVLSQTDYILGKDCYLLQNMSLRDAWHNTYHYLVLGYLHVAPSAEHSLYLSRRIISPLCPLNAPGGVDRLLAELQGVTSKPPRRERPR